LPVAGAILCMELGLQGGTVGDQIVLARLFQQALPVQALKALGHHHPGDAQKIGHLLVGQPDSEADPLPLLCTVWL